MYKQSRHKKYWDSYRPKKMTKEEKFQWIFMSVVFTVFFIFYFVSSFVSNCVFHWPIRFDVTTCWNEQIDPSSHKAAEKAVNFMP